MGIIKLIRRYINDRRRFFSLDKEEIAKENLFTLQIVGAVGTLVCGLFFIIAPIIIDGWAVTTEYVCILPVLAGTFLFSFIYSKIKSEPNPATVEVVAVLFYSLCSAVFIAISTFPYPNTPQIFISLCFMFMPVLLIIRPAVLLCIIAVSEATFLSLIPFFKTPFSIQNDIFNTIASILFALIIMSITNRLRCRNFNSRRTLEQISQTDALTGLLNKKAFEGECTEYLHSRTPHSVYAFIVIDLDKFKLVNDRFGHPFGDALLYNVGKTIRNVFCENAITGRLGGDEFGIMICKVSDKQSVEKKCAELCEGFSKITVDEKPFGTQCSIGCKIADSFSDYASLFAEADEMQYTVKRGKKQNPEKDLCSWIINE